MAVLHVAYARDHRGPQLLLDDFIRLVDITICIFCQICIFLVMVFRVVVTDVVFNEILMDFRSPWGVSNGKNRGGVSGNRASLGPYSIQLADCSSL